MSEILSSLLKVVVVFGLGIPLATLVAKVSLALRWRSDSHPLRHGSLSSFLLVVGPSLATVLWFVSAAIHRAEPGEGAGVCAISHTGIGTCIDSLLLALILSTVLATALTSRWRLSRSGSHGVVPAIYFRRLARLCRRHGKLDVLSGRVKAVGDSQSHPICVRGFFRPMVEVSTLLMDRLDDAALEAALLHEVAHVQGYDPLRYLLGSLALALNPMGFLLRPELRRWRAAREAVCDFEAVGRSADPLSLAEALVTVSRISRPLPDFSAGLGGAALKLLQLRIHLLLGYASNPRHAVRTPVRWRFLWIVFALILSPHWLGVWPLDGLHEGVEKFLSTFGLI